VANLLMVLNPRRIPECVAAIDALPIDKVWLERYTEAELVHVIPQVIAECDHDMVGAISDDGQPTPDALRAVLDLARPGRVATGWSTLDDTSELVNLSTRPLLSDVPSPGVYTMPTRAWVEAHDTPEVPTYFAGFSLTFMERALWERFPFQIYGDPPGCCSDFMLSWRLQQAGIPIVAARDAWHRHVKTTWNTTDHAPGRGLLIGKETSGVRWDLQEAPSG
jgi:hypothetical protein